MKETAQWKAGKCDCDVNALLDNARAEWKKGWKFGYIPWSETHGWVWCEKHHGWISISHEAVA